MATQGFKYWSKIAPFMRVLADGERSLKGKGESWEEMMSRLDEETEYWKIRNCFFDGVTPFLILKPRDVVGS